MLKGEELNWALEGPLVVAAVDVDVAVAAAERTKRWKDATRTMMNLDQASTAVD